jgi:hypothetical protein
MLNNYMYIKTEKIGFHVLVCGLSNQEHYYSLIIKTYNYDNGETKQQACGQKFRQSLQ